MFCIHYAKKVTKFIGGLPPKHQKQIITKVLSLKKDPRPNDSIMLSGYNPFRRCDAGEYRVIYKTCEKDHIIYIVLIGKRNDSQVYREFVRLI